MEAVNGESAKAGGHVMYWSLRIRMIVPSTAPLMSLIHNDEHCLWKRWFKMISYLISLGNLESPFLPYVGAA